MLTLRDVKGVGDATIKKLHDLDIHSVFEVFSFCLESISTSKNL